ncbi:unnamed protein product [Prorocentrum cordatum]|uniref:Uncharacterized protein n=1 Tax=Prorocentrum cordatum TaxID=2364126 RepID=A0ABN9WXQ2_9DINO|nr:unnamed protein product [Polarella glacialis]
MASGIYSGHKDDLALLYNEAFQLDGKITSAEKTIIREATGCEVQHRSRRGQPKTLKITGPKGMEAPAASMTWGFLRKNGIETEALAALIREACAQAQSEAARRYLLSNLGCSPTPTAVPAHDDWGVPDASGEGNARAHQDDSSSADAHRAVPSESCAPAYVTPLAAARTDISESQGFDDIPRLEEVLRQVAKELRQQARQDEHFSEHARVAY